MASVKDDSFRIAIEWLEAEGVAAPELAATWCRFQIWIGSRCVTEVEPPEGPMRRSVYGSAYPLAEWIARNWWPLIEDGRPLAVPGRQWSWQRISSEPWLWSHNIRGAGDGMAWPDLTIASSDSVSLVRWERSKNLESESLRFVSFGFQTLDTERLRAGLSDFVENVLTRLSDAGLPKTRLAEEWASLGRLDDDERAFCRAASRLGLDPFSIETTTADQIIEAFSGKDGHLVDELLATIDASAIDAAIDWTDRASIEAEGLANATLMSLRDLQGIVPEPDPENMRFHPWAVGYGSARRVRQSMGLEATMKFDPDPWVNRQFLDSQVKGIHGLGAVRHDRCGLVLTHSQINSQSVRFSQTRALGRALIDKSATFLISPAGTVPERVARAFAAELLAPAAGIASVLEEAGGSDDFGLEAAARHFDVSPLVINHQMDNQLLSTT